MKNGTVNLARAGRFPATPGSPNRAKSHVASDLKPTHYLREENSNLYIHGTLTVQNL